ncbi:MAG: alpha/beta hydrolase [Actinobacteria bacterium]|nr:alpha/beta hydrolase [Actinomycetota bacterium]
MHVVDRPEDRATDADARSRAAGQGDRHAGETESALDVRRRGWPRGHIKSMHPSRTETPLSAARADATTVRRVKVVLLHALPLDATMWHEVAEGLQYEVVAPDLYQLGPTLQDWASGVLDLAGPGPLVVVGNSVGGSCAIEVARLAPAAVQHLILTGANLGHRPDPAFRDTAVRLLETAGMRGLRTGRLS